VKSLLIGITGPIGSGKSTVARLFGEWGASIISSDDVARELMDSDAELRQELIDAFGETICTGITLNRSALAALVFADAAKLKHLNALVHPRTIEQIFTRVDELFASGVQVVVVESALIYSAGLEASFDFIVAVSTDHDLIRTRLATERGMSPDEVDERLRVQMESGNQYKEADFILKNSASLEDLQQSAAVVWAVLQGYA
jgi:dephospho-CoA kinase